MRKFVVVAVASAALVLGGAVAAAGQRSEVTVEALNLKYVRKSKPVYVGPPPAWCVKAGPCLWTPPRVPSPR